MIKACYINGISSLSPQSTVEEENFDFQQIQTFEKPVLQVAFKGYKKLIKPAAMRRMSKSVKMGVFTAASALIDADVKAPTSILTGTGMGCKQDSDIFLENLLLQHEELLSPSKFIQSTHNTVGGQVALYLKSKAYNFTYVQGSASFESALLDAQLSILTEEKKHQILVGGIDEISENTIGLLQLDQQIKSETPLDNLKLLHYKSKGSIIGEGAHFFVISDEKKHNSYAQLLDVHLENSLATEEVILKTKAFLAENKLAIVDIDLIILGNNGDVDFDAYFQPLQQDFKEIPQVYYKHLVGECYTASAFGMQLGVKILKSQHLPEAYRLNAVQPQKTIKKVLLYNQFRGKNHSWILLEHV
ncbi:beta-ketoacyl synthase chain length factor [Mesonia mobilis]|uniref:beta-ketoacyl synthase chain length factor n=1 Tax=Mesonia mobilis TaxID=369791 RepID=UPI0026EC56B2|nr:beta-ketoacyl synthase chain length factor [Mesonia mobilis]